KKHWRNVQATRAPQDARKTRVRPGWGGLQHPSHGENRGSSPLGSANSFKGLADCRPSASNTCPINVLGQRWTIRPVRPLDLRVPVASEVIEIRTFNVAYHLVRDRACAFIASKLLPSIFL